MPAKRNIPHSGHFASIHLESCVHFVESVGVVRNHAAQRLSDTRGLPAIGATCSSLCLKKITKQALLIVQCDKILVRPEILVEQTLVGFYCLLLGPPKDLLQHASQVCRSPNIAASIQILAVRATVRKQGLLFLIAQHSTAPSTQPLRTEDYSALEALEDRPDVPGNGQLTSNLCEVIKKHIVCVGNHKQCLIACRSLFKELLVTDESNVDTLPLPSQIFANIVYR
mmetsp:Transcript_29230/g.66175  ORF Transcript_29230/g.66175 Transcript_29230/m.66175 type:complete len:226 (-) Transcript_29230:1878-2555(-)